MKQRSRLYILSFPIANRDHLLTQVHVARVADSLARPETQLRAPREWLKVDPKDLLGALPIL